jgi:hypothetical protein
MRAAIALMSRCDELSRKLAVPFADRMIGRLLFRPDVLPHLA